MEETGLFPFFFLADTPLAFNGGTLEEDNTFEDVNHACVLQVAFVPLIGGFINVSTTPP